MKKEQRKKRRGNKLGAPIQVGAVAQQLSEALPLPAVNQYENAIIDDHIRNSTLLKVFTINGYQEKGIIRSHDSKIAVMVHDPIDGICLMYKHALSTIEVFQHPKKVVDEDGSFDPSSALSDLHAPTLFSPNDLESEWLSKFIAGRCHISMVTMKGYHEHGTIIAHDSDSIIFTRYTGDTPNIIYKHTLSTIYMHY